MHRSPLLFSGSSHEVLARSVCKELNIDLGRMCLSSFPDGETRVEIEEDVQGRHVFVLQSISGKPNQYLLELFIIIDALKRAAAKSVSAIIPYFGYCRQDRKNKPGEPLTAKLIANLLTTAGISHLITFDLHTDQIEGFFEITIDHLHCQKLLSTNIKKIAKDNLIVLAPDIGSIKIAERMAHQLNANLAVIKKERIDDFTVNATLIGDIENKNILIADDLCSTAGTLVAAAHLCKLKGAQNILAAVTHALFVDDSLQKIATSPLSHLFITDTVPFSAEKLPSSINRISTAEIIAEAIKNRL